jgi:hypothetical protein
MEGERQVTVPAPLEHTPILVRSGSILSFISPDTKTLAQDVAGDKYRTLNNDLIWRVFPAPATLYDGTKAVASQEPELIDVRVEYSFALRNYELILHATRARAGLCSPVKFFKRITDGGIF